MVGSTHTIVDSFCPLRWHRWDVLKGDIRKVVHDVFFEGRGGTGLFKNWYAAHGDPLRLAKGPNPCLCRSRVLFGDHRRWVIIIGIEDGDGTGPHPPALLHLRAM